MITYKKAYFLQSCAKTSQLPPDAGTEIAFIGRSNCGKSSTINSLTEQNSLARTSKTPGRTQLINIFAIEDDLRLMDLPGYGFAKVPAKIKQSWEVLVTSYLSERQSLKILVLLMDIRHPLTELDTNMLQWCIDNQVKTHLVLTKADKLKKNAQNQSLFGVKKFLQERYTEEERELLSIQLLSNLNAAGIDELRNVIAERI